MPDIAVPTVHDLLAVIDSEEMKENMEDIPDEADLEKEGISQEQLANMLHIWGVRHGYNLAFGQITVVHGDTSTADSESYTLIGSADDDKPNMRRVWIHNNNASPAPGVKVVPHWSGVRRRPVSKIKMTPAQVRSVLISAMAASATSQGQSYRDLSTMAQAEDKQGANSRNSRDQFYQSFPGGIRIIHVEGDRLIPAFESLILGIQLNHPGITPPTRDALREMLQHFYVRSILGAVNLATLDRLSDNLLCAVLNCWGLNRGHNLQLGVITPSAAGSTQYRFRLVNTPVPTALSNLTIVWVFAAFGDASAWSAVVSKSKVPELGVELTSRLVPEGDKHKPKHVIDAKKSAKKHALSPETKAGKEPPAKKAKPAESSSPLPEAPKGPIALGKEKAPEADPEKGAAGSSFLKNRPKAAGLLGLQTDPLKPDSDPVMSDKALVGDDLDSADRIRSDALLLSGHVEDEGKHDIDRRQPDWDLNHARGRVQCEDCCHWFTDEKAIGKHHCKGNVETDFQCPYCMQFLPDEALVTSHRKDCPARPPDPPPKTYRLQCAVCKHWIANTLSVLARHISDCTGGETYTSNHCPTCHLGHRKPAELEKHVRSGCDALDPEAALFFEEFICDKDFLKFDTFADFRAHVDAAHPNRATGPWACFFCPRDQWKTVTERTRHTETAHPKQNAADIPAATKKGPLFVRKSGNVRQGGEDEPEDDLRCKNCNEKFDHASERDAHQKQCKNFYCRICEKGPWNREFNRDSHQRNCNACPYCKTDFSRGANGLTQRLLHMPVCPQRGDDDQQVPFMARVDNGYEEALRQAQAQFVDLCEEEPMFARLPQDQQIEMTKRILETTLSESARQLAAASGELESIKSPEMTKKALTKKSKLVPTVRERQGNQVLNMVKELMEEVANIPEVDFAIREYQPQSPTAWLDALVAEARRLPWFRQSDRHFFDERTHVQNGRGSVYPADVDVGEYLDTQATLEQERLKLGTETSHDAREEGRAAYLANNGMPNPVIIVIMRFSGPKTIAEILQQHLANHLVARDYYNFIQGRPDQMPPPAAFYSIVINGWSAVKEIATIVNNPRTIPEYAYLVRILDGIQQQVPTPPVRFIIRSISGMSVAPHRWVRLSQGWPNLNIEIAFALRTTFWLNVRPDPGQPPLAVQINGPSLLNFYYTQRFSVAQLFAADAVWGNVQFDPATHQLNRWQLEEYDARNDHRLNWAALVLILVLRGHDRNDFV